jgi:hypothetical protein
MIMVTTPKIVPANRYLFTQKPVQVKRAVIPTNIKGNSVTKMASNHK